MAFIISTNKTFIISGAPHQECVHKKKEIIDKVKKIKKIKFNKIENKNKKIKNVIKNNKNLASSEQVNIVELSLLSKVISFLLNGGLKFYQLNWDTSEILEFKLTSVSNKMLNWWRDVLLRCKFIARRILWVATCVPTSWVGARLIISYPCLNPRCCGISGRGTGGRGLVCGSNCGVGSLNLATSSSSTPSSLYFLFLWMESTPKYIFHVRMQAVHSKLHEMKPVTSRLSKITINSVLMVLTFMAITLTFVQTLTMLQVTQKRQPVINSLFPTMFQFKTDVSDIIVMLIFNCPTHFFLCYIVIDITFCTH